MQLISHKKQDQEKNRSNLKQKRVTPVKRSFNFSFKNIASPGSIPDNVAVVASYLTISLLFFLDIVTGSEISFHILYVFPLIFIGLHSSRNSLVTGAVALSIALQFIVLSYFQHQTLGFQIYLFLIIAFSNSLVALVARYSRTNTLEVKRLSTTDPLTQLGNRRALENAINAEVIRQRRYGGHFSVAVTDLNGFKGLNDSMGHTAGDQALILLADILRSQTRRTDTIARIGGDEFVVLMPNTKAIDCDTLCRSICHTIGAKMTEVISYPVTASIGYTTIATIENSIADSSDILSIADKAMYQAKASGKGCVVRGYAEKLTSDG